MEDGNYERLRLDRLPAIPNPNLLHYDTRLHNHITGGIIHMKQYKIRCPFCGSEESKWEWLLKLRLIFTDKYYYDCPICHKKSTWLYFFHLRHDSTDKNERIFNKGKLFDDRI